MSASRVRSIVYTLAAIVSVVGLAEATYLTVLFLTGETAVCGESTGCFEVLGSRYAKIGGFPVAGLGIIAYFAAFSFATFAAFGYARARKFFLFIVSSMFAATLWLLYVQAFLLHAFCRYCLFSAAIIFFLTGLLVIAPPSDRSGNES
jgi:uncharacterized membrane protein